MQRRELTHLGVIDRKSVEIALLEFLTWAQEAVIIAQEMEEIMPSPQVHQHSQYWKNCLSCIRWQLSHVTGKDELSGDVNPQRPEQLP